ncbi:Ger(x)C family spore germination protein [Paenibacillus mucilaginosus]|uniref:Germination protein, Ger(X)C family n=1 Tax=Paenibacillus mucilaginosus (strain KNP414) TaxID=1036673 RepID=F8FRR3_PAEMK|nr:Ger(x)C family spore germination protein [Paenibacillus mucilaginosus]AEI40620.1 germination protein, Ger(x)C family [Paenibacillus mucilaginosus KNP414]MCG7216253.1 Ger(x)C family spore germination protein [Paenibacillus mucilaginosus]WDM29765.1 Ger(x)C family spore germination protein [Paenibacillus mucilaginosus]
MRSGKPVLIILIACCTLLLTGCWNRREMNQLAINMGLGIDKDGKGYRITAQVVEPKEVAAKGGGGGNSPVTVYQSYGKTLYEAIARITEESPRRLYLSHLRILVLGESLAKEGVSPVLDFLSRNHEMRTDFFIVVAKESRAEEILKVLTPIEEVPANKLFTSLYESEKAWAPALTITLDRFINDLVKEGRNPVLTAVKIIGKKKASSSKALSMPDPETKIRISGLAVFKKDKLIGWLDEAESKGYVYITNKVYRTVGPMACPQGGQMNLETVRSKTVTTGRVVGGKPEITIEVHNEGNIGEVQCEVDLTKPETIDELERIASARLQEIVNNTLAAAQKKYKCDIFGFGDKIRRSDPKGWNQVKDQWDKLFPQVQVYVKADYQIRRLGTVANSIFKQMKE